MFTILRRSQIAFLAAALLLLKAAMPWMASHAAEARGVSMVEVCTVYGVATVAVDAGSDSHPADSSTDHAGANHCNLTSLGAWVPPTLPAAILPAPASSTAGLCAASIDSVPHDACARWIAHLQHAPPFLT